ncbi:OLC1v1025227C1 [Oldenlandia corymbosa var. corymbosa]|uniref:OLC1v1025227C1 n=1 Tax=Oldenlandia corymbosa var. corymbosa TaxID=529605 RepID=A0AAV1C6D2_OLDCO|nr:OLC1v1025227C1 [Oldenlandia corymbosa var. corymbosa]
MLSSTNTSGLYGDKPPSFVVNLDDEEPPVCGEKKKKRNLLKGSKPLEKAQTKKSKVDPPRTEEMNDPPVITEDIPIMKVETAAQTFKG